MLVAMPFHPGDASSAQRFADWTLELGGAKGHDLILIIDTRCTPAVVDPIMASFSKSFDTVKRIDFADHYRSWPESANAVWSEAARYVYRNEKRPWFFCEPDLVLLRAGALDDFAAEYEAALKAKNFFVGDIIQDPVPHCSGCAIYPWDVYSHCGSALIAGNQAFDIAAAGDTGRQTYQSELLLHVWKAPPFADQGDLEAKIFARRPKCALFHSAKDESLIRLLRERKNFSGDVSTVVSAGDGLGDGRCALVDDVASSSSTPPPPAENPLPETEEPLLVMSDCNKVWIKVDADGKYLGTYEFENGEWVQKEIAPPSGFIAPPGRDAPRYEVVDGKYKRVAPSQSWHDQTPWASQGDSVAEIRRLAARLKQFQTSSPRVRYVRSLLHEVGVIQLVYRYKRRKGWKRKKS